MDLDDPAPFASIDFTPPDRLLSETGLLALTWTGAQTRETYRRPSYTEPRLVAAGEDVAGDLVDLLNGVRKQAGLRAVEIERGRAPSAASRHLFPVREAMSSCLRAPASHLGSRGAAAGSGGGRAVAVGPPDPLFELRFEQRVTGRDRLAPAHRHG